MLEVVSNTYSASQIESDAYRIKLRLSFAVKVLILLSQRGALRFQSIWAEYKRYYTLV